MNEMDDTPLRILRDRLIAKRIQVLQNKGEEARDTVFSDLATEFLARVAINDFATAVAYCREEGDSARVAQRNYADSFRYCVQLAAQHLDEGGLARFIEKVGTSIKRGTVKPLYDEVDFIIATFWNGATDHHEDYQIPPQLKALRTYPPLSRWSAPAAREFVNWLLPRNLHVSYTTYRQRVRRLKLKSERPILVTKFVSAPYREADEVPMPLNVVFSPGGQKWIATQTSKKLSHDKITPTLFNAANENGKSIKRKQSVTFRAAFRAARQAAI